MKIKSEICQVAILLMAMPVFAGQAIPADVKDLLPTIQNPPLILLINSLTLKALSHTLVFQWVCRREEAFLANWPP